MMKYLILIGFLGCLFRLDAKNLGSFGETFPIQETDIIDHIQNQLLLLKEKDALAFHEKKIQNRIVAQIENPISVMNMSPTAHPRTFFYDPSITVQHDLKDHQGRIFQHKGTRFNPLHYQPLTKPLLFIDGNEPSHVDWALRKIQIHPASKLILTSGKPFDLMNHVARPVFFDQHGKISSKLGIKHVPAIVLQSGDRLSISEEKPDA